MLELLPHEQVGFQRMLDTIRKNFERFGFLPIETPVMELTEILLTKSGGETERQVYLVQSTGAEKQGDAPELALRFDLTVPLARYVAEHESQLTFPFRRYQIQRVYRGERAQRGRFREFYQCDIDVIGKDQLPALYDAEMPAVIHAVFTELGIGKFTIQINHRKVLRGLLESLGVLPEQQSGVLRELDKLDKRGEDHVRQSLRDGFQLSSDSIERLVAFIRLRSSSVDDAVEKLDRQGVSNTAYQEGRNELVQVMRSMVSLGVPERDFALNFSIARGLDYYTGIVYETSLDAYPEIGSICSGGRYENLAGYYTRSHLPGVGISIGFTRLFWQLREAGLLPAAQSSVEALVTLMDADSLPYSLALARTLRQGGINTEVVLEPSKLGKQFKYADRAKIRFVVVQGPDERGRGAVTVKDLQRQTQVEFPEAELVSGLSALTKQSTNQPVG